MLASIRLGLSSVPLEAIAHEHILPAKDKILHQLAHTRPWRAPCQFLCGATTLIGSHRLRCAYGRDIAFALCSSVKKGELFTAPSSEAFNICPCAETSTPKR
jgi:hypothetical protein